MSKAQHPKAASLVRQRFFAGVTTFAELETRIAALPEEQARGNAFEVFAEAYLATQRKHDAAKVWPLASVPSRVLQALGLAAQDYGVDGVFETALGHFNAYQVKFRTGRPALAWRELSTFMGLADSPRIRSRVLFTNCDDLPPVLNERQGFFCIRGSDLDRLEAADFQAIGAWLADAAFVAPRKQPQPHQTEALDALLPSLETHDRVSAIMACGTGKTLVALWVAERRQASRILVLVPSLALLRQILHEWLRETSLPRLAYLCVCSDPTVKDGTDAIATSQSDLDFQVSTDAANVRAFLDTPFTGTKIVFSTYQSARVVGAALKPDEAFGLAVFDEAHKTAGREGRNYAFALEDTNLPIRKRLFLTATPRHYNPLRKDKEGDAQLVFSMDRPEVYGPQAYRLTFAEAARRGIICGYKVVISVITSEMVTNDLLSRGEVLVNGSAVRARQVANQIALRDAIGKYGVKKVFTFHSTVKSAASFVSDGPEGVGIHLADEAADVRRITATTESQQQNKSQSLVTSAATSGFQAFHVNGTMPTARRECEMRDFRAGVRAVMSNARCLMEGVDVPAVDMVAFLSPHRSSVDIVQATGRAMRHSLGKTTGYVLVPLYVELAAGETVEAAVSRADFDEVWDVLQSLQEQDEVLAEIIREMRQRRGERKGFDDSRFRNLVSVVGPELSLEGLRLAVATACIETLGLSWDERLGELAVFRAHHGHSLVPKHRPEFRQLSNWVGIQRKGFKQGCLSKERIARLNELGFVWNPFESKWDRFFAALAEFKAEHGHCDVPFQWPKNPSLSSWISNQRNSRKTERLAENRIERLEGIGFVWEPLDEQWDEMLQALKEYRQAHGNCNVLQKYAPSPKLGSWVNTQRMAKRDGSLSSDRIEQLNSLEFNWAVRSSKWEEMLGRLLAYRAKSGDCHVPANWPEDNELANWVTRLRTLKKAGTLADTQIERLSAIGFEWDALELRWDGCFARLANYSAVNGHANVPAIWPADQELATWVGTQRKAFKSGRMSQERAACLEQIGLTWSVTDARWHRNLSDLAAYARRFGHCNVPEGWPEDPVLATWVANQRRLLRRGLLNEDQIRCLEGIGFESKPARGRQRRIQ